MRPSKVSHWVSAAAVVFAFVVGFGAAAAAEDLNYRGETPAEYEARMKWFREARFGIFIHWGPVSLVGQEIGWARRGERRPDGGAGHVPVEIYDQLYRHFNIDLHFCLIPRIRRFPCIRSRFPLIWNGS